MPEAPHPRENLEMRGEELSPSSAETANSRGSSLESAPWNTDHKGT